MATTNTFLSTLAKYFKAPWKITGPLASPEFLESVVTAGSYRPIAPASQTVKAIIPHAEPENIYNIAYFKRDHRVKGEHIIKTIDPKSWSAEEAAQELPPTPGPFYASGKEYHINDTPHGGYQR